MHFFALLFSFNLITYMCQLQENRKQLDKRLKELNDSEALRDARKKFVSFFMNN